MNTTTAPVDYFASAQRHFKDANILLNSAAKANSGQLFGFCVECGLKALLVACGVKVDSNGGIPKGHKFRTHIPKLSDDFLACGELIPDSVAATRYFAQLSSRNKLSRWSTDHRYYRESAIPLADLPGWGQAAQEVIQMLEQVEADGTKL